MALILVVDDEQKMRHLLSMMLERNGHTVDQAADGMEAFELIEKTPYDIVITDIKMPRLDGVGLLKKINEMNIPCPVVFISAFATVESAVETMRLGAVDYITKPFEEDRIQLTVERTLNLSRIFVENRDLKHELNQIVGPEEIIYSSRNMADILAVSSRVAKSETAVMLTGESGTGKELIAKFIHNESPRKNGRFVPVNCAAISGNLVESELFGYEKGAFTGANQRTKGKFEYASGGTLFLDEIGDLPVEAQAKLLRALQEKKIQRVGGNKEIDIDVRIICATNQNLEAFVDDGRFRQDLYFRINVFPIEPPPLRDRKEDILPLAEYFSKKLSGAGELSLTDGAKRLLSDYHWPGNVRELANAIERAVILSFDQESITAETFSFLRPQISERADTNGYKLPPEGICFEELENDIIGQALKYTSGNQTAAAKLLGITRAKFRVMMKQAFK